MTERVDDDFEPIPGAEGLPDDVKDGDIGEDDPTAVDQPPTEDET